MPHEQALRSLQDSLQAIRHSRITIADLCRIWRGQSALLADLPPRYTQVMEDLLGRLEAGSLFTEESCSFSQIDLLATLDMWLDKSEMALSKSS